MNQPSSAPATFTTTTSHLPLEAQAQTLEGKPKRRDEEVADLGTQLREARRDHDESDRRAERAEQLLHDAMQQLGRSCSRHRLHERREAGAPPANPGERPGGRDPLTRTVDVSRHPTTITGVSPLPTTRSRPRTMTATAGSPAVTVTQIARVDGGHQPPMVGGSFQGGTTFEPS